MKEFLEKTHALSGFIHMVNNFKVAEKYWRVCRSSDSLHKYEDLKEVYFEKPYFKIDFRKFGFIHMVNNFKVARKYWRGYSSSYSLHEYENLKLVYLTYFKSI